jgi:LysM repeat protein
VSDEDEPTQFWDVRDDPEATGKLGAVPPAPREPDEEATQVRAPGSAPEQTVRYAGPDQRNWLAPAPARKADEPPVYRARRPRQQKRSIWPRIIAPVVFLGVVLIFFGIVVDSGLIDRGGNKVTNKSSPTVTAKPRPRMYVVKKGDTPSGIANKFGTSVEELQRLNPRMSSTTINPGEKIKLPPKE